MDKHKETLVLGIDPGTRVMGFGFIHQSKGVLTLKHFGICNVSHLGSQMNRLLKLHKRIKSLINEFKPDVLAVEAPFYGKNIQSMLKIGRVQGIAMGLALDRDIPVYDYAPKKIKQSVTGNGNASKEQVAAMVKSHLKLDFHHQSLDETDALAVALCHLFQSKLGDSSSLNPSNNWKTYLKERKII